MSSRSSQFKRSLNRLPYYAPLNTAVGSGMQVRQVIDPARLIHGVVGCTMRTNGLKGAHGTPYGLADNHEKHSVDRFITRHAGFVVSGGVLKHRDPLIRFCVIKKIAIFFNNALS